jgi:hypothetical protein
VLAYNAACDAAFEFGRVCEPNVIRYLFTPHAHACLPNWEPFVRQQVAMFRGDCGLLLKEPWIRELVEEMSEKSAEFRQFWAEHAIETPRSGHEIYEHPRVGLLSFDYNVLQSIDSPNLRLVLFVPDTEETRQRIADLVAHHGCDESGPPPTDRPAAP